LQCLHAEDWEFLQLALQLQEYWRTNKCCHLCRAHKTDPALLFTDFRRAGRARPTLRTHADWLASATADGEATPLVAIPGFDIWRCQFDLMHTLELGILQHAIPAALQELATAGIPAPGVAHGAPATAGQISATLRRLTSEYHAWCGERRVASKVRRITPAWVEGDSPSISQKHAKAAALRSMMYWLKDLCAATAGESEHAALRAAFFDSMCAADYAMRRGGRFLDAAGREAVARHVEDALLCYNSLGVASLRIRSGRWPFIPKLHALTHIAYDNVGVNPRHVHCYADEDMVGRIKRVYIKCHADTAPQRALQRYALHTCLRWWLALRRLRGLSG
jgi:hypothetical protein